MTTQISFPPLLDLSPDELEAHKQHLLSEISPEPEKTLLSPPPFTLPRLRAVALVGAAAGLAAAVATVFAVVGTGGSAPPSMGITHLDPGGLYYPSIDWAHPGGRDGQSFSSVADAANRLSFQPVVPSGLGAPAAIVVDPRSGGNSQLDVAFDNSAPDGTHWLIERTSESAITLGEDTTTQILAEYAQLCPSQPGACPGQTWRMVPMNDGHEGLLIKGPAGTTTSVIWVENGIFFNVIGPSDSFSADQATSVANSVIAAATGE
jgi:hypothetical protein